MTTYPNSDIRTWQYVRSTWKRYVTILGAEGDVFIRADTYKLVMSYGDHVVKQFVNQDIINADAEQQLFFYAQSLHDELVDDELMFDSLSDVDPEIDADPETAQVVDDGDTLS